MSLKTSSKSLKSVDNSTDITMSLELNQLRERMSEYELRHINMKAEFEALKQLNEELSLRHEKQLKELKLDLRIAKRDADKWQDHNRYLRDEKKELKDQLIQLQTSTDELKQQLTAKDQQIERLLLQIQTLNDEFSSKLCDQKAIKESFEERIKCLNNESKVLREQLNKESNWKQKFDDSNRKSDQLCRQLESFRKQMESIQNDLISKNKDLEQKDKELNKLRKTNKVLQDQCREMDRQAEQFKNKYQGLGVLKDKWIEEKDSTQTEVQKLFTELDSLRKQLKSAIDQKEELVRRLDSQQKQYQTKASNEKSRLMDLEQTLEEVLQKNREYEERLNAQENNYFAKDELIVSLDTKISHCEEELYAIKEEAAQHITTISELQETNKKLTNALEEYMERVEESQTRIDSLHNQLEVKEQEMSRERIANQETMGQQLKLIDFLQKKAESLEKQKKPFISITPTKKFLNKSPIKPVEIKELDRLLAEERTKNRRLVEELNKIKNDVHYYKPEVNNSIKSEDLSQNKESNQLFRKPLFSDNTNRDKKRVDNELQTHSPKSQWHDPSGSRMRHNIPHRFSDVTNKIPNNRCVFCADIIHFGKKAKKCTECTATTHFKCAQRLPNNCGLPVQLMQHLFHSSNDVNSDNFDDYYQTQPIDDVIEVQTLEPSAPEETFLKYDDNSDSSATTDNNESDSGAVLSTALISTPNHIKEIQDICDNKENDNFSFTDSMLEIIQSTDN